MGSGTLRSKLCLRFTVNQKRCVGLMSFVFECMIVLCGFAIQMSTGNTQPVNVILLMPVGNAVQINLTNPIDLAVGACRSLQV